LILVKPPDDCQQDCEQLSRVYKVRPDHGPTCRTAGCCTGGEWMKKFHRYGAVFAIILGLFVSITGLMIQTMDLWAEHTHAPATDDTQLARRAGLYGPPNFVVIDVPDYTAATLPAGFDWSGALTTAFRVGEPAGKVAAV